MKHISLIPSTARYMTEPVAVRGWLKVSHESDMDHRPHLARQIKTRSCRRRGFVPYRSQRQSRAQEEVKPHCSKHSSNVDPKCHFKRYALIPDFLCLPQSSLRISFYSPNLKPYTDSVRCRCNPNYSYSISACSVPLSSIPSLRSQYSPIEALNCLPSDPSNSLRQISENVI